MWRSISWLTHQLVHKNVSREFLFNRPTHTLQIADWIVSLSGVNMKVKWKKTASSLVCYLIHVHVIGRHTKAINLHDRNGFWITNDPVRIVKGYALLQVLQKLPSQVRCQTLLSLQKLNTLNHTHSRSIANFLKANSLQSKSIYENCW